VGLKPPPKQKRTGKPAKPTDPHTKRPKTANTAALYTNPVAGPLCPLTASQYPG